MVAARAPPWSKAAVLSSCRPAEHIQHDGQRRRRAGCSWHGQRDDAERRRRADRRARGLASGTIDGAIEIVSSGGMDVNGTVTNGGTETLAGIGMQTAIESGGSLTIDGGLVEFDGAVLQGSVDDEGMLVFDLTAGGATFAGTLTGAGTLSLQGGGTLVMGGGDAFDGTVALNDGTFELTSRTAVGNAPIDFGQDGSFATLQIDGIIMPTNTISNFGPGGIIDLAGVSFDSNGTVTSEPGSELQIYESADIIICSLIPASITAPQPSASSATTSRGHGLLRVRRPLPAAAPCRRDRFFQHAGASGGSLGVLSGSTASGLAIDSGGLEYVSGGGTDVGTVINDGGYQYVLSGGIASNTLMTDPERKSSSQAARRSAALPCGGEQDVFGTTPPRWSRSAVRKSSKAAAPRAVPSSKAAGPLRFSRRRSQRHDDQQRRLRSGLWHQSGATIGGYEAVSSGGKLLAQLYSAIRMWRAPARRPALWSILVRRKMCTDRPLKRR